MLEQRDSVLLGLVIVLFFFSLMIGKNQMIRIIVGNYILMIIALAFDGAINMWSWSSNYVVNDSWSISRILSDGRITITIIVYALLLALIFKRGTLQSDHPGLLDKGFFLLLIPMTIIGISLSLGVIFLGINVFDPSSMATIAQNLSPDTTIQSIVRQTPLWITIHGLLTVLITTHISLSFFVKKPLSVAEDLFDD